MAITNAGATFLAAAATGIGPPTLFDSTHAYLCVGDDSTAFNATQTDLVAASNKLRVGMDATYPQLSSNVATLRSTFTTGQANFHWQEWGAANAASSGTLLNRKAEDLGTKTSAQTWQLTAVLTFQAA